MPIYFFYFAGIVIGVVMLAGKTNRRVVAYGFVISKIKTSMSVSGFVAKNLPFPDQYGAGV